MLSYITIIIERIYRPAPSQIEYDDEIKHIIF